MIRCAAVFIMLICSATTARAEFGEDYERGLRAFDAGRYDEAQKYLQQALAAQSEPVEKVRLNGDNWQPYLPHHFLGMVALKKGDCAAAAEHWNSQANRRMLTRLNQLRQQEQALLGKCEQVVADKPVTPAADAHVADNAATKTGTSVAGDPATTGTAGHASISNGDANPAMKKNPAVNHGTPPEPLVQAFESYLAGHYAEVARINPDTFADSQARFHAYLVRSAARYTQGQLDGDKDMLDAARADARAAAALDGAAVPDSAMFSPRFRAFYTSAAR